jgi:hypothetical protein
VRFDGAGLSAASAGEGVGHQVYTSQSEGRATIPVDLSAVQALDNAAHANEAPKVDHTVTLSRNAPAPSSSPTTPPAPVPRVPLPEGRVPKSVLRLIFGAIALVIIGYLIYKYRG